MAGKSTDRKGKLKDAKSGLTEPAAFTLPDSLPCSEIDFPIVLKKPARANWKQILEESNQKFQEIEQFVESKKELIPNSPFLKTECDYINKEVFPLLLPALEETLDKAKIWNALVKQNCFFNGLDYIVENLAFQIAMKPDFHSLFPLISTKTSWKRPASSPSNDLSYVVCLTCRWMPYTRYTYWSMRLDKLIYEILNLFQKLWNNNPRYPDRISKNLHPFNMPWVRQHLREHPRPYYPKSWLWPEDYAATVIQKSLRQYFVQREEDVQEMREFWRKLKMERSHPDMETNPFLARKFASEMTFKKH